MQEVRDPARLQQVFETKRQYFQAPPPVMRLLRFEKGEFLSRPFKKLNQFLLVVEGHIRIYDISDDSRIQGISAGGADALLGDIEFCSAAYRPFYTEAVEPVLCLAFPFAENRTALENDPVFLRFVLGQLARKLEMASHTNRFNLPLEERLLLFLESPQSGGVIRHLNDPLLHLHCSRRQLQRVLKKLCEEGQLEKTGRGCYRLAEKSEAPV